MANATYCDSDYLRKQRERRAATGNATTKKYERTKNGKLMRTYRNMQSRVTGILKKKRHLYEGLPILPRAEFYRWANASNEFHRLFDGWVDSGYRCGESPSVDRIDSSKGYTLGNMRWLTHRENSRNTRRSLSRAESLPLFDAA
jgi:hypothetical protein